MAQKKKGKAGQDFPEHLRHEFHHQLKQIGIILKILLAIFRDFMLTIEIKEDPDDPKERARRAAAKRKQKEAEAALANNKSKIPVIWYLLSQDLILSKLDVKLVR